MKKTYYIVDSEKNRICYEISISTFWDSNESPEQRKGENLGSVGFFCGGCGLCVGFINSKTSFLHLHVLEVIAWGMIYFALVLFVAAAVYVKMAEHNTREAKHKKSGLPWSDPYQLVSRYPNNDPSKKIYYIIDNEKNAIVDVKRLGKWGQAYVEWRGKRQKQKTQ